MKIYFFQLFLVFSLMSFSNNTFAQDTTDKQNIGATKYKMFCAVCHGKDGKLNVNGATDLSTSKLSKKKRIKIIREGKGLMLPFKGILKDEEIKAIAKYLDELIEK